MLDESVGVKCASERVRAYMYKGEIRLFGALVPIFPLQFAAIRTRLKITQSWNFLGGDFVEPPLK